MASDLAFVPHKPDRRLSGAILYAVRLEDFSKLGKRDQQKLIDVNPDAGRESPIFYIGQTSLLASERFENHRNGYKASRWVRKYGQQLIEVDEWKPDFGVTLPAKAIQAAYELGLRSKDDPLAREKALTELLRMHGYFAISH